MDMPAELLGAVTGVVSAVISTAVSWGVMNQKIERLEDDVKEGERKYVSTELFAATIQPLRDDLHQMRLDLREILRTIQRNEEK